MADPTQYQFHELDDGTCSSAYFVPGTGFLRCPQRSRGPLLIPIQGNDLLAIGLCPDHYAAQEFLAKRKTP